MKDQLQYILSMHKFLKNFLFKKPDTRRWGIINEGIVVEVEVISRSEFDLIRMDWSSGYQLDDRVPGKFILDKAPHVGLFNRVYFTLEEAEKAAVCQGILQT